MRFLRFWLQCYSAFATVPAFATVSYKGVEAWLMTGRDY
jgi:hypothetical protein